MTIVTQNPSKMFIIYGRRTARIRKYRYESQSCENCNSFGVHIKVYRDYYHLFFLPLIPVGINTAKICCNNCKRQIRPEALETAYEEKAKAPIYLYAGVLLFLCFILLAIFNNLKNQKETAKFVEHPTEGDVYRIRKNENNTTFYYFFRINEVSGDTVHAYHSNLMYNRFTDKLSDGDYFDKSEYFIFTKAELKEMLDNGEIESVERKYNESTGFNRIK